ncbi:hypothetical protein SKAU_G00419390 [Synaphobranchus kaupii]|uniref:Syndecan n=1 Tax=Synaphobranchus kaupii TaxID=118154 RepID=A0A9Q1I938_SYNKA|nr:hypothetical protein SKAU_G00419390 [Synaphobranchus kaupii]
MRQSPALRRPRRPYSPRRVPPTTAVPPVPVDATSAPATTAASTEASTRTPVLTEEEEEGDEEEEGTPTHIEETDMPSASTPAFETDLEEMASGEEPIAASTVSPWATNSVEPAGPLIHDFIIPETRSNVEMEKPEVPSDYDIVFVSEVSEEEVKTDETVSENQSLLERKEVLGGVIAGGVVGLAFAIMLVSLMVYRMKKKDEGSYALDEHKHPNGGYQKARRQEEFLA